MFSWQLTDYSLTLDEFLASLAKYFSQGNQVSSFLGHKTSWGNQASSTKGAMVGYIDQYTKNSKHQHDEQNENNLMEIMFCNLRNKTK